MLFARQKNRVFKDTSVSLEVFPMNNKNSKTQKCVQRLLRPINFYLWIHGVGFEEEETSVCRRKFIKILSVMLLTIFEGNVFLLAYMLFDLFIRLGFEKYKAELVGLMIVILNSFLRYFLYKRRSSLKDTMHKIAKIYSKITIDTTRINRFMLKLAVTLFINDLFCNIYMGFYFYNKIPTLNETYHYADIPPPYGAPVYYFTMSVSTLSLISAAVTAYFCSACFVLKETLLALDRKLRKGKTSELQFLSEVYFEVITAISEINTFLYVQIILSFAIILIRVFRQSYFLIFSPADISTIFNVINVAILFSHFAFMCLSGSMVTKADLQLKMSAQRLLVQKLAGPGRLRLFTRDCFQGFRIMDSMVIDAQLILSPIGCFFTYGILIATFNTSRTDEE